MGAETTLHHLCPYPQVYRNLAVKQTEKRTTLTIPNLHADHWGDCHRAETLSLTGIDQT
jgi:hypothetical protein